MASSKQWDAYAGHLATWGQWEPVGAFARDALAQVRDTASGVAVATQALELMRRTWATLPPEVRGVALGALRDAGEELAQSWGQVSAELEGVPIANIATTIVAGFVKIGQAAAGVAEIKRYASNYAHGQAQYETAAAVLEPSRGFYTLVQAKEFAQYVKVRIGGDFDRKPCFSRAGLARDRIFTGVASPPDDPGHCSKKMRRSGNDSYGPFDPKKCGRTLGLSAMLWPWWSAAYEPVPVPRWDGAPAGAAFDPGLSPDTNGRLVGVQTRLITDPRANLESSLQDVTAKAHTFLTWWDGAGKVYPLDAGRVSSAEGKRIDAKKDPKHVPSQSAAAYWYLDADGSVVPYEGQAGAADLNAWGKLLPQGDPADLAVSLAQHNAVIAMRAAFAQRRLATLRQPRLVEAIVQDSGVAKLDHGARDAILFARSSPDALLPWPGERVIPKRAIPGRIPPIRERKVPTWVWVTGGLAAVGAVAGGVYALRQR